MQMIKFTWDELAILAIYKLESPSASIAKMEEALPYIDDPDMVRLVQSTIKKLKTIEETEYQTLNFNEYKFLFEEDN